MREQGTGNRLKVIVALFSLLFLLGCSRNAEAQPGAEISDAPQQGTQVQEAQEPRSGPYFILSPDSVRPGEPVTVAYSDDFEANGEAARNLQAVLLNAEGKRITKAAFFSLGLEEAEPEIKAAVLAIPSTAAFGNATVRIESGNKLIQLLPLTINPREFTAETIQLNQANTDLRTVPDPQKTAESELLWAILSATGTDFYSGDRFVFPVSSTRLTSTYGDRRVYQYAGGKTDTTIHAGIDVGVPVGTEVRACAAGKVVLARNRIVTGKTVILEHLPGLYSLYYHMDKIDADEGTIVQAGVPLGKSGSTGLATGPHLHWEIRVSTENADPDAFLARPILDKKDIIDKIKNSK